MEKEGLERVLDFLELRRLKVAILVTDRHKQINKWLRENHPEITHYYDVWHVAKGRKNYFKWLSYTPPTGLRKKLEAVSKQKECEIIGMCCKEA